MSEIVNLKQHKENKFTKECNETIEVLHDFCIDMINEERIKKGLPILICYKDKLGNVKYKGFTKEEELRFKNRDSIWYWELL